MKSPVSKIKLRLTSRYGYYLGTIMFLVLVSKLEAQLDSILDQGVYRTFIVHLPAGYSPANQYPIVISLHGLNSNAAQEESYTQFDAVADQLGFITVYPNAINGSWALFGDTDVDFIDHLIDTIKSDYSANNCLFFTGISDGGFMTYTLACNLPRSISAIAPVAGNMTVFLQNNCALDYGLPVMHFHGTADQVVAYAGAPGIPPVESTVLYWANKNNCAVPPDSLQIPDTHPEDNCTATRYTYPNGDDHSEVIFYKIINGGHTWPGAFPFPPLGNTIQDIDASALMGAFFKSHC
ncbi:MAG TPA: hypothetical protein VJ508_20660, partial [Saprospiraceae bacterium]|nr:hypothetical protein [Saprospiraceae bacterium]